MGGSLISLICVGLVVIVLAAVFGGLAAALYAWVYNITFRFHGGLKVEVE